MLRITLKQNYPVIMSKIAVERVQYVIPLIREVILYKAMDKILFTQHRPRGFCKSL